MNKITFVVTNQVKSNLFTHRISQNDSGMFTIKKRLSSINKSLKEHKTNSPRALGGIINVCRHLMGICLIPKTCILTNDNVFETIRPNVDTIALTNRVAFHMFESKHHYAAVSNLYCAKSYLT